MDVLNSYMYGTCVTDVECTTKNTPLFFKAAVLSYSILLRIALLNNLGKIINLEMCTPLFDANVQRHLENF